MTNALDVLASVALEEAGAVSTPKRRVAAAYDVWKPPHTIVKCKSRSRASKLRSVGVAQDTLVVNIPPGMVFYENTHDRRRDALEFSHGTFANVDSHAIHLLGQIARGDWKKVQKIRFCMNAAVHKWQIATDGVEALGEVIQTKRVEFVRDVLPALQKEWSRAKQNCANIFKDA